MTGLKRKVHDLKKYAVATLWPDTNLCSEFSGHDFDRIGIRNVGMVQLSDNVPLDCPDCADRMIKPGGSFIVAIKLSDGTFYSAGTDDDGNLPTPIAPHKVTDSANHGDTSRKRQREYIRIIHVRNLTIAFMQ